MQQPVGDTPSFTPQTRTLRDSKCQTCLNIYTGNITSFKVDSGTVGGGIIDPVCNTGEMLLITLFVAGLPARSKTREELHGTISPLYLTLMREPKPWVKMIPHAGCGKTWASDVPCAQP